MDVWRVNLDDTIQTFGTQPILNACASDGTLCDLVSRNPETGDVFLVQDLTQNAASPTPTASTSAEVHFDTNTAVPPVWIDHIDNTM
jgi:hypothetical protein